MAKLKIEREKKYVRSKCIDWALEEKNWTEEQMALKIEAFIELKSANINLKAGEYPDEWLTFLICSRPDYIGLGVCETYCVGNNKKKGYAGGKSVLLNGNGIDAITEIASKPIRKRFGEYLSANKNTKDYDKSSSIDNNERIIKIQFERPTTDKVKELMESLRERISLAERMGRDPRALMEQLDAMLEKQFESISNEL